MSRRALWEILKRIGLEEKVIRIIQSLYQNTKAEYNIGGIKVENVRSKRGLR